MAACRDEFAERLAGFDRTELDAHTGSIYALDLEFRLAYHNEAYLRFAEDNGARRTIEKYWGLGCQWLDVLPACLAGFYRTALERCLRDQQVWEHEYECSSAENFRRFHQRVYPLRNRCGLLIVNSVLVDAPHDPLVRRSHPPDTGMYADEGGIVHQCAHCRRVECPAEANRWDWIPAWLAKAPTPVSHGLCPVCLDYYYPEVDAGTHSGADAGTDSATDSATDSGTDAGTDAGRGADQAAGARAGTADGAAVDPASDSDRRAA